MKFIGQLIQDFVARFRNDVYLEDLTVQEEEYTVMVAADGKLTKSTHPGERSRLQVRNDEGSTIPAGAPLYSKGEIGGSERILVGVADANDSAKMPCIGIAEFEMNTTSTKDSFAITQGVYNTNISGFTGLSEGDILYVDDSGSAPYLTQNKSDIAGSGNAIQNIGIVLKTNGSICQGLLVSAIGRSNDVPNLDNNTIFIGNASNQTTTSALSSINVSSFNNDSGFTSNTGDITTVAINEGGNTRTVSSGDATIQFIDGEGIDLASSTLNANNVQLTISGEDASTSNKGIASFSSDNFAASSGAISIKSGGIDLTDEVTGALPVGNGGTGATTLASNSILTGNGTSAVQAESGLTYDSEILNVGDDDDGVAQIKRLRHTDDNGGDLYIRGGDATGTDKDGGPLRLYGGRGTGAGSGGAVTISTSITGSSGSTLHSNDVVATFKTNKDTQLSGNLVFEGPTPDVNETTFSITDPTADRTITVPDATGTMCISGASGTNMVVLGSGTGYVASPAAQTWYFGNSLYGFNHFNWASVNASMVADSATFTLSEDHSGVGQLVPAALSKVVLKVNCRPAGTSNETLKVTLCSADRNVGGANTTWTALASATNETSIGVYESCDVTYTGSIATSKILSMGIGIDEASVSTTNIRFTWQLIGYLT